MAFRQRGQRPPPLWLRNWAALQGMIVEQSLHRDGDWWLGNPAAAAAVPGTRVVTVQTLAPPAFTVWKRVNKRDFLKDRSWEEGGWAP